MQRPVCVPDTPILVRGDTLLVAAVVTAGVCLALPARAGDAERRELCVDYANEAVEMQRLNIRYDCGIHGLRWSDWWDGHYGWCRDWAGPGQVREQTELRRVEMDRCIDARRDRPER